MLNPVWKTILSIGMAIISMSWVNQQYFALSDSHSFVLSEELRSGIDIDDDIEGSPESDPIQSADGIEGSEEDDLDQVTDDIEGGPEEELGQVTNSIESDTDTNTNNNSDHSDGVNEDEADGDLDQSIELLLIIEQANPVISLGLSYEPEGTLQGAEGDYAYKWSRPDSSSIDEGVVTIGSSGEVAIPSVALCPQTPGRHSYELIIYDITHGSNLAKKTFIVDAIDCVLQFVFESEDDIQKDSGAFRTTVDYQIADGQQGRFQFVGTGQREYHSVSGVLPGSYNIEVQAPQGYKAIVHTPKVELNADAVGPNWEQRATIVVTIQRYEVQSHAISW